MAHFKPILTLTVEHLFFADGRCTNLIFSPTPATRRVMQQYQLLMRIEATGFSLIADQECLLAFDEEAVLRFEVFAQDPYFGFYTLETQNRKLPLYYHSKNITADNTSLVLLDTQPAESQDTRPVRAKPGDKTPLLIVDIDLSSTEFAQVRESIAPVLRNIKFNTRDIYWKYYFFGELAKLELEIHDLSSQLAVAFDPSDEVVVKNGKAFISQTPIAMNSAPKQRFQLKDKSNAGKILIKRLPNAGVNLISRSMDLRGQQILVAEIYVNQ
ncbi:hypothetical protein [Cellvibrio sp. OA-2007]|uniref:hypothetical protein n=1 Tax=Cellvibrio sp. OA-2007 TaxID=529823 RepID=UPI0007804DF1|nr:hypothetical protein [Cellvibrio sp. OA-2007]